MENKMYKRTHVGLDGQEHCVKRLSDNAFIPFNTDNIDYQEYLKWVAEGNTPEPADSGE